ncbi:NosD domain-containing protein [Candidatus Poribacteria bacterium]
MKKTCSIFVVIFLSLFAGIQSTLTQDLPPGDPEMPPELLMSGRVEGTGTHFEITDSEYLNITLDSTEEIHLTLESIPEMVTMSIESASDATSTVMTLTGFLPLTTYYKYEDDYHNEVAFTTEGSGSYSYVQDLSAPHSVFIQPRTSTIYLSATGWSKPVGIWDPDTNTGTLTQDLLESVQIDSSSITLNGNGHTITGNDTGYGIYLKPGISDVTVENCHIARFTHGIVLDEASYNNLINNTLTGNDAGYGVYLKHAYLKPGPSDVTVKDCHITGFTQGIVLDDASYNNLINNTVNNNRDLGIVVFGGSYNNIIGNTANSHDVDGILLVRRCSYNNIIGNTANSNGRYGIFVYYLSHKNILTNNIANSNSHGITFYGSCKQNKITNNTANLNSYGIRLSGGCTHNNITSNTVNSNTEDGIQLYGQCTYNNVTSNTVNSNTQHGIQLYGQCTHNNITSNTVNSNTQYGIYIDWNSNDNIFYNNNFINNPIQAYISSDSSGNISNLEKPIGGNYWSDWTTPDDDGDGFVDNPYVLTGGQDNLPWARPDGWENRAPVADAGPDQVGDEGSSITFDGSGSSDPDGSIVSYEWDLDDDGEYDDATGPSPSNTWDDDYSGNIGLKVTDDAGATNTDSTTVAIDNAPPTVGNITAEVNPVSLGSDLNVSADFTDPGILDTHTVEWDWEDGGSPTTSTVTNGSGTASGSHTYADVGVYEVTLTVTDDDGGSGTSVFQYAVVYDPTGGFVTGGGWIDSPAGAYIPDPTLTGKANFGFVSKYKKGATIPTGQTEFLFHAGDMDFHSTYYDWLVIAGAQAKFKGTGVIKDDDGDYGFMLTAVDGQINGGGGTDKFRIKIWDKVADTIVYDNQMGDGDDTEPATELGGGSIVIHKGSNAPMDELEPLPDDTALLLAYPNPTNPDAWIPYRLSNDSQVTIRVYDMSGRMVCTLDLGHKTAGFYTAKSKAAYWDGKNEAGEQVSSGIYFYSIQAGDFTATKKMIVTR